jgi:O-succinylbenzoic acid--CoA ligase
MERAQLAALIGATGAGESHGGFTFLCDPHWTPAQRAVFADALRAQLGDQPAARAQGWLCIPTGGSSGGLRFARHDEQTLSAAARGFLQHFNLPEVNVVDVLPPWHVSGLLARVRCGLSGGRHVPWAWKDLEAGRLPELDGKRDWVISLVPTQLQRLLEQPAALAWLRQMRLILIGGGPAWGMLIDRAVTAGLPVALSYGMTETAAMVVAQTPADGIAGDRSSGRAMPHVRIEIRDEDSGAVLPAGEVGLVVVAGQSVMRGYFGAEDLHGVFSTADRGCVDDKGRLHIVGRRDDVIITGGEKVNPREVEAALRDIGLFADVAIIGRPHPEWGEEVVACYVAAAAVADAAIENALDARLLRQHRPKQWVRIEAAAWPRNAQGKVNRAVLREIVSALRDPSR